MSSPSTSWLPSSDGPRDFVDLLELEPRDGLGRLCPLAAENDRDFSASALAEMLARFGPLRRGEFDL